MATLRLVAVREPAHRSLPGSQGYTWSPMATRKKRERLRVAVSLAGEEAEIIARAAAGAKLRPTTWAKQALLRAAERSEAVVVARAAKLMKQIEEGVPGGREHGAGVAQHRREGWSRGRR